MPNSTQAPIEGILLLHKSSGPSSFSLVNRLRRALQVRKIGHTGTLDPLAKGLMVFLIGRSYTKLSDRFLNQEKEYVAQVKLGFSTTTYDREGEEKDRSDFVPTFAQIEQTINTFNGETEQLPPMFSAKKINGQKLYNLARRGIEIERKPQKVCLDIQIIEYDYPNLVLQITCSKGAYIRSLAHDLGQSLSCYAHLDELTRIRSGDFHLKEALEDCCIEKNTQAIIASIEKNQCKY